MKKNRTRFDVINKICEVILNIRDITPTNLIFKANLSPQMFNGYKKELIKKGFIKEKIIPKGTMIRKGELKKDINSFELTNKGREYLDFYKKLIIFKEKYGLDD